MTTRKFKIICNRLSIGFIFISDNNPLFPNCIVATIWPFERQGNWTTGDLELVVQRTITDIYNTGTTDELIKNDLMERANISIDSCHNFEIMSY
jgi:hypothetical protein